MIELASDLAGIRRYVAPAAHRCRVELDDLVSETALEILVRCRRQPGLRVSPRAMLYHATNEALRRVVRRCYWPRRAWSVASFDNLAALPPALEDEAIPPRRCSNCAGEFVPVRRDARYCSRVQCGRARAAQRQRPANARRRAQRAADQSPTTSSPSE